MESTRGGGVAPWRWVATTVAVAGLTASLTGLFLAMRKVMDIGGSCADGGPYISARPCPDGAPVVLVLSIFGLFLFGGAYLAVSRGVGSPALLVLAWPALFGSLGFNFLQYGIAPPASAATADGDVGYVVTGVVFELMALPVLVTVVAGARAAWGRRRAGVDVVTAPTVSLGPFARLATVAATRTPTVAPHTVSTDVDASARPPAGAADDDLVDRLERLAALHASGALSDAEYAAAKAAVLEGN